MHLGGSINDSKGQYYLTCHSNIKKGSIEDAIRDLDTLHEIAFLEIS